MADNLNMKTVTLNRVLEQVKFQLRMGDYSPIIVIGKSGIGKTESLSELAKDLKIGFVELRLSHYDLSDLIGLPYVENGRTKHAETNLFPDSKDKNAGILLLDEVTSAPKNMRSAVYQLLDSSRKLGEYKLPEKWLIVCCGNGPDDGGDFRGIEPALLSRGRCMRVEEDLNSWKKWAVAHNVHPTVIAYLSFSPISLHVMDPDKPNDMIACPRNWVKLSTQLNNMEKIKGGKLTTAEDEEDLEFAACCCVGESNGPGFVSFYKYSDQAITVEDIVKGNVPASALSNMRTETMYIITQNIAKYIKDVLNRGRVGGDYTDEAIKEVAKIFKWIIEVGEKVRLDLTATAIQELGNTVPDLVSICIDDRFSELCPEFTEFTLKNDIVYSYK